LLYIDEENNGYSSLKKLKDGGEIDVSFYSVFIFDNCIKI